MDLSPVTLFDIRKLCDPSKRLSNESEIRARFQAVYLGHSTLLCRVLGRYKFFVHGGDTGITPHLLLDGLWEIWVTEFVVRNITSGAKTIDLGSNYGYYTVLMGHLGGKDGHVTSIEPNPFILPFLERNVLVNKLRTNVTIDRRAISDKSGEDVNFYCPNAEPKNAKIASAQIATHVSNSDGKFVTVKTLALDDLNQAEISFIKVDVEGAEEKFWFGSKKFLARNPNAIVLLEFNPRRLQHPESVLDDIATMYPLRYLWSDGKVYDTTREHLIANAKGDWMLVLANRPFK